MLLSSAFVVVAWLALVNGSLLELQPIQSDSHSREISDLLVSRQTQDLPPQCKPICDPPNAKLTQGCRAVDCCSIEFEQSYYDCGICVGHSANVQDYSGLQKYTDSLVTQCVNHGYTMKKLTYPGQDPNRPLVTAPPKPATPKPTPKPTSTTKKPTSAPSVQPTVKPTSTKMTTSSTHQTHNQTIITPVSHVSTATTNRVELTTTITGNATSHSLTLSSSNSTSVSHTIITASTQTDIHTPTLLTTVAQSSTLSTTVIAPTATQAGANTSSGAISSAALSHLVALFAVCAQLTGLLF